MADPAQFLERWSQLKRAAAAARNRETATASTVRAPDTAVAPAYPAGEALGPKSDDPISRLPPLETLTKDSDYTVFMRAEVPDELRNAALRKLWGSDPVYANLDGLVDYGEDFGEPFRSAVAVATLYRVLQGMPGMEEQKAAEPSDETAVGAAVPIEQQDKQASIENDGRLTEDEIH